jgi:hypothetical protein
MEKTTFLTSSTEVWHIFCNATASNEPESLSRAGPAGFAVGVAVTLGETRKIESEENSMTSRKKIEIFVNTHFYQGETP